MRGGREGWALREFCDGLTIVKLPLPAALARQGRHQEVSTRREDQLSAITDELDRIRKARADNATKARDKAAKAGKRPAKPNDAVHRKAECALRDHLTLGRWLKQHPATRRLPIDRAKVTAETKLDGGTCWRPPTRSCPPRTSRSATRTFWKPNARSARVHGRSQSGGRISAGSSLALSRGGVSEP
ncbi:hypothetical protein [Streptomyces sp. NPDC090026]|uniref:hypothetical protein n=1 Tax=Streptomyces sp. NPDC090026 TaxID=3365923 RepID=UPI0038157F91